MQVQVLASLSTCVITSGLFKRGRDKGRGSRRHCEFKLQINSSVITMMV